MAQAFEIPTGNRKTTGWCSPAGAILKSSQTRFPGRRSRPARPISWIDQLGIWVGLRLTASAQISIKCAPRPAWFPARRYRQG